MSRDEGMTPEEMADSFCREQGWVRPIMVAALRLYGEQERRRARAEALEEAGKACDVVAEELRRSGEYGDVIQAAQTCATNIRALAEQPPPKEQGNG